MKQLLQRYDTGELILMDVPVAAASGVQVLVRTRASLISAGTERALVEFSRAGLLEKARSQPDRVREVLQKVRTDGVAATVEAVRAKLQDPVTLGYCSAGVVVDVGPDAQGFAPGDRVVTNGPHGEYTRVAHTLAARIPDNVDFTAAAFTPLAAIALQGIRIAAPTLGETVVVFGLGLVGQLAVQLLRAGGARVIGIDRDPARIELARLSGAHCIDAAHGDIPAAVLSETGGVGADAVLLTLASDSDEPLHQAAGMSRKRGRIVLVGVTGLRLRRDDFYRRELSFTVSCSYGPGRYDPSYEEAGSDYPLAYVRWTEQRNFAAVLQLMGEGRLDPRPLVTHRFEFARAAAAYDLVTSGEPSLGILLDYPAHEMELERSARTVHLEAPPAATVPNRHVAAVIGAGSFAQRTLIPAMQSAGFVIHTIVSGAGTSAAVAAHRFNAAAASTDLDAVLDDPAIGSVFVLTRHDSHAAIALRALRAGKHVFVEKPLALRQSDIDAIEAELRTGSPLLTVGFNRRFAELSGVLRTAIAQRAGPAALIITVNAGHLPREHWTHQPAGGGRIAGEACHFIDLARSLIGSPIATAVAQAARDRVGRTIDDIATLLLTFEDGSTAAIHYLSNGSKSFQKERLEAFVDGATYVVDNWRRLHQFGGSRSVARRLRRQDKGHLTELRAWRRSLDSGSPPIPYDELLEVSRWTLRLAAAAGSASDST